MTEKTTKTRCSCGPCCLRDEACEDVEGGCAHVGELPDEVCLCGNTVGYITGCALCGRAICGSCEDRASEREGTAEDWYCLSCRADMRATRMQAAKRGARDRELMVEALRACAMNDKSGNYEVGEPRARDKMPPVVSGRDFWRTPRRIAIDALEKVGEDTTELRHKGEKENV